MRIKDKDQPATRNRAHKGRRSTGRPRRQRSNVSPVTNKKEGVRFIDIGKGLRAVIDAEEWPRIRDEYGVLWHANSNGSTGMYARRQVREPEGERRYVTLQRAVLDAEPHQRVKVINGDPLDCRKANLKFMSEAEKKELIRRHAK